MGKELKRTVASLGNNWQYSIWQPTTLPVHILPYNTSPGVSDSGPAILVTSRNRTHCIRYDTNSRMECKGRSVR
jgi:hypothetical protein